MCCRAQVREALLRKKERLVGLLKGLMARVPRGMLAATGAKFGELERQLKTKPASIEDVDAQRRCAWAHVHLLSCSCSGVLRQSAAAAACQVCR